MKEPNDAVGTQPDPGVAPKSPRRAPTVVALLTLGAIALVATLLIVIAWL